MSEQSNGAWGWKVTVHVYGTGPIPSSDQMFEAVAKTADAVGANDMGGVDFKRVKKRPNEQVGS
jgi:hypothetical protein